MAPNNLSSRLLCFIFVISLTSSTSANPIVLDSEQDSISGRIIGGMEATPHEFPWQVSLEWVGGHVCGGIIISETAVLTSASCADLVTISSIYVRAGRHHLNETEGDIVQKLSVSKIFIHPEYPGGPNGFSNDIAILKLVFPIEFNDQVNIIPLIERGQLIPGMAIVSGWGSPAEETLFPSDVLMKADIPVISDPECKTAYGEDFEEDSMICAGNLGLGGVDFCTGDNGGPLIAQKEDGLGSYYLIGISSWGLGCGQPNYPGVYTEISHFLDFIEENL